MPGNWITNQQVEIYMKARTKGYTQEVAAAKSGMSERTAREIEQGKRVRRETLFNRVTSSYEP